jgi:glycogen debranching enzyme
LPGEEWKLCLQYDLLTDDNQLPPLAELDGGEEETMRQARSWQLSVSRIEPADIRQVPELFAGLPKEEFAVSVPYRMANVPQAWSAGAVLHMVRILLGLEPDLPAGRVYVDPALPAGCLDSR